MKRLYFALAVAIVMAGIILTGTFTVKNAYYEMNTIFRRIEVKAENEEFDKALVLCEEAEKKWVKYEKELSIFVNHEEVCNIGVSLSAMKPLIEYKEKAEFFSEINKARTSLTHLASLEKINLN